MSIEHFHRALIPLLSFRGTCTPYICFAVLAPADDVSGVVGESCADLTAIVLVPSELHLQAFVPQIVKAYSGVVT